MNKTQIILAMVLMLALASNAVAQSPNPIKVYVGGGLSMPLKPSAFKDSYDNGYHAFAGVGMSVFPMVQGVAKVAWHQFPFDDQGIYSGGEQNIVMFGADARIAPSTPGMPFKPYGFVGLGFATIKNSDLSLLSGEPIKVGTVQWQSFVEDQTKLYYNLGAGAEIGGMPIFRILVQANWVTIMTEGDDRSFVDVSVGAKLL